MKKELASVFFANLFFLIINLAINFLIPKYVSVETYSLIKTYNDKCPIDLIKFDENNLISVTKCNHGFHYDCIKKYLLENEKNEEAKCPICLSVLFSFNNDIP